MVVVVAILAMFAVLAVLAVPFPDSLCSPQVLEIAMARKLNDDDLGDEGLVRAKVKDLNKLGELKWRYRVVEEGQNPRDEAIKVLGEARTLIESHITVRLAPKRSMAPQAPKRVASAPNPTPEAVRPYTRSKTGSGKWTEVTDAGIRLEWARELSEICQGLAVARLIFNTDRTEDGVIMSLLKEALELREKMQATDKMADTVNSLGMLKQKQKAYKVRAVRMRHGMLECARR